MSDQHRAVFLSYASQDAEAAKTICESLRHAGVEVWFDQSELRGGDAWDQKIRKQIKECALFVPIISANTQARGEGYFRLEWKLAADRSHLMARDQAFILPIAVDGTSNAIARVPEEFLAVQWTRLPAGDADSAFALRVQNLLGASTPAVPPVVGPLQSRGPAPSRPAPRRRSWLWPVIAVGAAGLFVAIGYVQFRPAAAELRRLLEADTQNPRLFSELALMEAFLGSRDEAVRLARKAVQLLPESVDAFDGPDQARVLAEVYALTGDKDSALREYARLLREPGSALNVHEMRRFPEFAPLRGDPRFEALLDDPKNNAPLF